MSHAYRFKLNANDPGQLIEAASRGEARTIALRNSSLDRLDASEVMAAVKAQQKFASAADLPESQAALPLVSTPQGMTASATPHNY